jgi:isocitrate lyase
MKFDWEACRSDEGYYRIKGNIQYCIKRGLKFGEMADMIWMETPTPDLTVAKEFADGIFAENPNLMLAYNLSPSFNWEAAGLTDEQISTFIPDLA